jgi:hypothetical protein
VPSDTLLRDDNGEKIIDEEQPEASREVQSQAGFSNQTPVSTKRGGKKRTPEASHVDEMYLEYLNKLAKRVEDDSDPDLMFLRSYYLR